MKGSKDAGIVLKDRSKNDIFIEVGENEEQYTVLKEFPFDSTRKRMSVIVKHGDKYELLTKGADNIMEPRIAWNLMMLDRIPVSAPEFHAR